MGKTKGGRKRLRKFIDKEDLLGCVTELTNDWGYGLFCVLEEDVVDATEEEAIDIDWIVDYVDSCLSDEEADVVKRMVGTWYDEFNAEHGKKKKTTLTEAFKEGYEKGSKKELIQCKDCMFFRRLNLTNICEHNSAMVDPTPEGYCNFAERK